MASPIDGSNLANLRLDELIRYETIALSVKCLLDDDALRPVTQSSATGAERHFVFSCALDVFSVVLEQLR